MNGTKVRGDYLNPGAPSEGKKHESEKHPYVRNNFKGSEEVQRIRKEKGIKISWLE